tara:strand:- start:31 stop:723 length:693 start_codon:yes stop_codon:yes gene_type:complete
MSNLTDFFPAASSGGLSVDPLDMRRHLYGESMISTKWGTTYNATYQSNATSGFWELYSFNNGYYANSVAGSYTNLIDVTSSANGGYLLNCIGRPINSTQYCNFKITVDGKETIIPVDRTTGVNNYTGNMVPVLGNITSGIPNITTLNTGSYLSGYPNNARDFYRSGSYSVSVNGFSTGQRSYARGTLPVIPMTDYQMGIKFNETLKVDIQTDASDSTSLSQRIAAQYQLR